MTTATTKQPKTRVLSFRVTDETVHALKLYSKFRGTTDVEALQRTLEPFTSMATVEVLGKLRRAIEASVADNTRAVALETLGGSKARQPELRFEQQPEVPTVQWNGIDVHNIGTEENPRFRHTVKVYEGQTTAEAVTEYVETLWRSTSRVHQHNHEKWLNDVEALEDNTRHVYVLGFVEFRSWALFRTPEQYTLWRKLNDTAPRKDPESPLEWAVYGWCMQNLRWYLLQHKAREKAIPELPEGIIETMDAMDAELRSHQVDGVFHFYVYPDKTEDECLQEWAQIVVATLATETDPERYLERLDNHAVMFITLRIEPQRKPRAYTKKDK